MGLETALIISLLATSAVAVQQSIAGGTAAKKRASGRRADISAQRAADLAAETKASEKEDSILGEPKPSERKRGRLALIATSSRGILSSPQTGRRKLLGN